MIEEPVEIAAGVELDPVSIADPTETDDWAAGAVEAIADETPIADDFPIADDAETGKESVPFYKREISFRRRAVVPVETSEGAEHEGDVFEFPAQSAVGEDAAEPAQPVIEPVRAEIDADEAPAWDIEAAAGGSTAPTDTVVETTERIPDRSRSCDRGRRRPAVRRACRRRSRGGCRGDGSVRSLGAGPNRGCRSPIRRPDLPSPVETDEPAATVPLPEDMAAQTGRRLPRREKKTEKRPKRGAASSTKGRRVVGLKIGASQIAAAVVIESESGHELVQLARTPLGSGIVVDGEVRDQDALATRSNRSSTRRSFPRRTSGSASRATASASARSTSSGIDDETRFDNAVRFKAHEVLPVGVHESLLDYRVLDERPNEAGEQMRCVLLVVAPRDQVSRTSGLQIARA